jgi:uncharacterized protein (TIGR03085 family)
VTDPSLPLDLRERRALADLLDELGPDAPTVDEGWTTAHLAAHLVTRDRRPDALPGYGLEVLPFGAPLARWSHTVEDRLRTSTPYAELVRLVGSGPPPWMPFAWPGLGKAFNTTEFAIHHEDARRAQPGWEPRVLPRADQDRLWPAVALLARGAARRYPGGLRLRRTDTGAEKVVGGSSPSTTVAGEPLELLLWASGRRSVARVELSPSEG